MWFVEVVCCTVTRGEGKGSASVGSVFFVSLCLPAKCSCEANIFFFFLMIRRPPISTPFPSPPLSRSSRQAEALIALVEPVLFEQRAPQHEASVADLVHPVGARDRGAAVAEPLERMSRVLFGLDR